MNILIIDTETTGINPEEDQIIEIGAVLYSVTYKTILMQLSTLLPVIENKAEHINKISADATFDDSVKEQMLIPALEMMICSAGALVAHNADFDKSFLLKLNLMYLKDKPWVCTLSDVEWPMPQCNGARLIDLAIAHEVPVVSAHRALTDCLLLASIFDKQSDLYDLLDKAGRPKDIYRANISFEEKDKARDAGFNWNRLVKNAWAKKMTPEAAAKIPFSITKIGN
jgi:DNA polymerase-3 subunit epsilon